jgi:xylan 1,4-beta-xylosidase
LRKPGGKALAHGMPHSDSFERDRLGTLWNLYGSAPSEKSRIMLGNGELTLAAKGKTPADGVVLTQQVGDRSYEVSVDLELSGSALGGLLLFFDDRLFLGMAIDGERMTSYRGGKASYWPEPAPPTRRISMRIVNQEQIVTFYYSVDGKTWTRHGVRSEVSGYNANTVDNLLSLRPALFGAGEGKVTFRNFRYKALA